MGGADATTTVMTVGVRASARIAPVLVKGDRSIFLAFGIIGSRQKQESDCRCLHWKLSPTFAPSKHWCSTLKSTCHRINPFFLNDLQKLGRSPYGMLA
jgi:hypothetical protein